VQRFSIGPVAMALFCVSPLLFGAGPEYVGCGGGTSVPSTGTPLPIGEVECAVDADCPTDACTLVQCIAGECVETAPVLDADGDGQSPPPCGPDCDDTRADVGSGFAETCDGLDNDCNMLVDDGAGRIDRIYPLTVGDPLTTVVPWGDRFVVTDTTSSAIFGVPVTVGGEQGRPFEIVRLVRGAAFTNLVSATGSDGRVLFVTQTDTSLLRYLIAAPDGDDFMVLEGPADVAVDLVDIQAIDAIAFGAGFAIAVEGRGDGVMERVVLTSPTGPPVIRLEILTPSLSFALATDGTHLVLTDPEDGIHFFLPTGEEVVGFTLPGLSRAVHPIASWRGAVVALVGDAFDFNLGFVDSTIGLGSVQPAPFGDATDAVTIHTTADRVLVARLSPTASRVQALEGDLTTYDGEVLMLTDGIAGQPIIGRVSVAESSVGIGVAGGNVNASALGVVRGCAD
jgi:hypothetical protein